MSRTLHLSGNADADALLADSDLALLLGMQRSCMTTIRALQLCAQHARYRTAVVVGN